MSRIKLQKELRRGRLADRVGLWLLVLLLTVLVVSIVHGVRTLPYSS